MRIVQNSAKCLACGDHIESTHRHHFVECGCGQIFVDGGRTYLRRGAKNPAYFKDTSITEDQEYDCG